MKTILISLLLIGPAFAADFPVPKASLPNEPCMVAGQNGKPVQILVVDKNCKSGLRWVYRH